MIIKRYMERNEILLSQVNTMLARRLRCGKYKKILDGLILKKNRQGDLAVMSIETYELLAGKMELYSLLDEGLNDDKEGNVKSSDAVFAKMHDKLGI